MTIADLRKILDEFDDDQKVMILDSFNGGGFPREINFGPYSRVVTANDAKGNFRLVLHELDCEEIVGETVVIMGFGCY